MIKDRNKLVRDIQAHYMGEYVFNRNTGSISANTSKFELGAGWYFVTYRFYPIFGDNNVYIGCRLSNTLMPGKNSRRL